MSGMQMAARSRPPTANPHAGHQMPGMEMPAQSQPSTDSHARHQMPGMEMPAQSQASTNSHAGHQMPGMEMPAQSQASTDPHAGHQMPGMEMPAQPQSSADPRAGHAMPGMEMPSSQAPASTDPHAGHQMPGMEMPAGQPQQPESGHAGHDRASMAESPRPPVAPPPAAALSGPQNAADPVYGAEQMAAAREDLRITHGGMSHYRFSIDQLETRLREGRDGFAWEDVQFWYGGDIDKLWLKSEGEGDFHGEVEGDVQALWSHAIDPWFDIQGGLRLTYGPGPERPHLAIGIQGRAPYWFEVDAAAFLSSHGDLTGRAEVEYEQRITERLILQPRAEIELSAQDMPELRIGSGLSTAEAGLRLRYEIAREFGPYVGVQYERAFGNTADFRRAAGEDVGGLDVVFGVRIWF